MDDYNSLRILIVVQWVLALVVFIAGIGAIIYGLASDLYSPIKEFVILGGFGLWVVSLQVWALTDFIRVVMAIERNTRRLVELQETETTIK